MIQHGIQTQYRHLRFRSRLEATWARFFDAVGWQWKYEPFDYDGYIPDFVLLFRRPVLVEVKPVLFLEEMKIHTGPIDNSPWKGEAIILGVGLLNPDNSPSFHWTLGLHGCLDYAPENRVWEPGLLHQCPDHTGFHASYGGWTCRSHAEPGCDHHQFNDRKEWFNEAWALSQNLTQWAPRLCGIK